MELVLVLAMGLALVLAAPLTLLVWGWVLAKVVAHWTHLVRERVER
jgi:hypothetical protein